MGDEAFSLERGPALGPTQQVSEVHPRKRPAWGTEVLDAGIAENFLLLTPWLRRPLHMALVPGPEDPSVCFHYSHPSEGETIPHCGFDLHFPNDG